MRVLGAIIAGGHSSRMGGEEKAFISLAGIALLSRVMSRIGFQVDEMVINANGNASRFTAFGKNIIADELLNLTTPLAGLHAALSFAQANNFDAVLTVPSDTPFLPLDLVSRLSEAGQHTGAAIATSGGQQHYLTGLWSSAMVTPLAKAIATQGIFRMKDLDQVFHIERADWMVEAVDPFFNINTPHDLIAAEGLLNV
jgi:molybdopterin-guanine dinucleotide biosynthesis protein A